MKRYRIIFCGTPDFALPTLELLAGHPLIEVAAVVTPPDRPAGRGQQLSKPPVAQFAIEHKLPLFQTDNLNQANEFLTPFESDDSARPDFMVVVAFSQFLNKRLLTLPRMGAFNIHGSLLPALRGAAPIQHSLLTGARDAGVSIQKMVRKMDAGDVVLSRAVPLQGFETSASLFTHLKFVAADLMAEFIVQLHANQLHFHPQQEELATYAPAIEKQQGKINLKLESAQQILNKIRAFTPWPGSWLHLNGKLLKVHRATLETTPLAPGELATHFGTLLVGTACGSLRLDSVQLEGKKICSDHQLLNGLKGPLHLE